jgi:sporulation protein YlmC with PRC-barrel domain
MLRRAQTLIGTKIHAVDGELGQIDDLYFDDLKWTVRYMIVRTGSWFSEKRVMLSPSAIRDVVWEQRAVYVDLTEAQIKKSPDLDLEKPVTREQELELVRHYQWPSYWLGSSASGVGGYTPGMSIGMMGIPAFGVPPMGVVPIGSGSPNVPDHIANDISSTGVSDTGLLNQDEANTPEEVVDRELTRAAQAEGLHGELHGVQEITDYHLAATDGEIGRVEDFFIDEETWKVQYFLVDTSNWLSGRKVLVATDWITDIVWADSQVRVNATIEQIESSPDYDPNSVLDRRYEATLYNHYGYPPYWG